jgi:hypothetical protein
MNVGFVGLLPRFGMLTLVLLADGALVSAQNVREVDCDRESLQDALSTSKPGDTLRIAGTCRQPVTVTVDRLTLDGLDAGAFDGGVPGGGPFGVNGGAFNAAILIDGARGVTVRRFTIRNSPGGGIIGQSSAAFKVQSTLIQNNYFGIVVQGSSQAEIESSEISGNTDGGIGINSTSTVVFRGSVKVNRNLEGISASGNCDLELLGANLEASGNKTNGIALSGCSFNVRNFGMQSRIIAHENGLDGLFIGGGQLVIGESFKFGFAGEVFHEITATNNAGSGINLAGFASIVNLGGAKFELRGNATGLNLGSESSLLTIGGFRAQNNGIGILADGAGTVTLVSTPRNQSIVRGNGISDMDLRFGTRMTVDAAIVEKLICDGTILSRGTTKCP